MSFYTRKSPRIPNYDYASANYYFITICTHNHKCFFGSPTERNNIGIIAEQHIKQIDKHYKNVRIDKYVVMPNHIHMILVLENISDPRDQSNAEQIVAQYKSGVTREVRKFLPEIKLWQRSFHDHIIRSQPQYEKIWMYIETNPQRWCKDCFYTE